MEAAQAKIKTLPVFVQYPQNLPRSVGFPFVENEFQVWGAEIGRGRIGGSPLEPDSCLHPELPEECGFHFPLGRLLLDPESQQPPFNAASPGGYKPVQVGWINEPETPSMPRNSFFQPGRPSAFDR